MNKYIIRVIPRYFHNQEKCYYTNNLFVTGYKAFGKDNYSIIENPLMANLYTTPMLARKAINQLKGLKYKMDSCEYDKPLYKIERMPDVYK